MKEKAIMMIAILGIVIFGLAVCYILNINCYVIMYKTVYKLTIQLVKKSFKDHTILQRLLFLFVRFT